MITRIQKEELLRELEKNMSEHRAIFEEAVEGYKKQAVVLLEEYIERIKSGNMVRVQVALPEPSDHTRDYERTIAMINMSEDDVIELNEREFGQYVLDDWDWKYQFLAANSMYSETAQRLSQP